MSAGPQNETTISFNPLDPRNVVGGANDYRNGDSTAGWYTSFDGGMTFTDDVFPLLGTFDASGDPGVAFGPDNRVHFAMIQFQRDSDTPDSGIFVATSTDGGSTWGPPIEVSTAAIGDFDDKELIACDTTGGPDDGNVYVSWTKFRVSDSPIFFSRSTDGGDTYSAPFRISDAANDRNQGSIPAVGPGGEVYVVWKDFNLDRILLDRSFDGGVTFGSDRAVATTVSVPFSLPGFSFRGNSFPYLAVDRSGGSLNGRLYCVWNDHRNGDADIFMATSDDEGHTWTAPRRVNDDPAGNGGQQFFPFVTVTEGGAVDVMYYDNIHNSSFLDVTMIRSRDGGASFSPSIRVTSTSFDPFDDGFGGKFIGDYNGMASSDNATYPLWTDCRSGVDADAFISRVELAFQSDVDSISAESPNEVYFSLDGGPSRAGVQYVVVGGRSGTDPGTPFGQIVLPLNTDDVSVIIFRHANGPVLQGFRGHLDAEGHATATLAPASDRLMNRIGDTFHFCFVKLNSRRDYVSQALSISIAP